MESQRILLGTALTGFVRRHTGVAPWWKPSGRAHCATSAFFRDGAAETAALLNANKADCTLDGAPLLDRVSERNGWILVRFAPAAIDALAARLPEPEEPDESFFARRLWIWAQHGDRPTPDDPAVLQGAFETLFGAPHAERTLLSAPYQRDGIARVELEHSLFRIAKVLLWERRNTQ